MDAILGMTQLRESARLKDGETFQEENASTINGTYLYQLVPIAKSKGNMAGRKPGTGKTRECRQY